MEDLLDKTNLTILISQDCLKQLKFSTNVESMTSVQALKKKQNLFIILKKTLISRTSLDFSLGMKFQQWMILELSLLMTRIWGYTMDWALHASNQLMLSPVLEFLLWF